MQYLIISIVFIGFILFYHFKKEQLENFYINQRKQELEETLFSEKRRIEAERRVLAQQLENLRLQEKEEKDYITQLQEFSEKFEEDIKNFEQTQRQAVMEKIAEFQKEKFEKIDLECQYLLNKKREEIDNWYFAYLKEAQSNKSKMEESLTQLNEELETYKMTRAAINEEIRRRREIEEQNDFYRVCLSEYDVHDIKILNEVKQNLKNSQIVDIIIYDNYVKKHVLDMIKRVLQNTTCSGIYKITCLKTGEIYIGKSTDIKNRWQQHCKTVFNCGTIASSHLHKKMQQHGIENFTFELLEKVPKEQLSEKEKYYINFYQTKEVGLNERNG